MSDLNPSTASATPRRSGDAVPWFLWPNLLSLDAVAVAVVWLWCFAIDRGVPLLPALSPGWVALTLGLAVWLIYTGDRLLDGWRMKDSAQSTPRHRFARKMAIPLMVLWGIGVAAVVYVATNKIPVLFFEEGVRIAFLVFFYFVVRLMRKSVLNELLPKEFTCGIIFALGATFPVMVVEGNILSGVLTVGFILFALLCVLNCVVISIWEWREDSANDDTSRLVKNFPKLPQRYVRYAFLLAVVAAWQAIRNPAPIVVSVALSAALLGAIGLAEGALSKNLRRLLVDVALLTPLVVVRLLT